MFHLSECLAAEIYEITLLIVSPSCTCEHAVYVFYSILCVERNCTRVSWVEHKRAS